MDLQFEIESREVLLQVAAVRARVPESYVSTTGNRPPIDKLLDSIEKAVGNLKAQFHILTPLDREEFIKELRRCGRVLRHCSSMLLLDTIDSWRWLEDGMTSLWDNAVLRLMPLNSDQADQGDRIAAREISTVKPARQSRSLFMHYTISEDRCGGDETTKSALLAALGAREEKLDLFQHVRERQEPYLPTFRR